jgi:ABC-type transport system substrate-binding protein
MEKKFTRREFLRIAAVAAAATAAGCATPPTPVPPAPTTAPVAAPTSPPAAQPTAVPATKPPAQPTTVPPTAAPKVGGTLNYAEAGDFTTFNAWRMEAANNNMHNQLFDRLVWKDEMGKEQMGLAQGYEMAKDGLSATVKMRENAKWHDGKDIVAQDIVNMFQYTKDEKLLAAELGVRKTRDLFVPIKDVKAVDKFSVQFVFNAPLPYFTDILDYFWVLRIDDPADAAFMKKPPVGSGPFKLTEYVPNQYARFAKHTAYHVKDRPILDTFTFRRLDKAETLTPNLQSGAVQGIYISNVADVAMLKADKNFAVVITPNPGSFYPVMLNCNKPPLDKKEVRQALSYAMNRVEMAKSAFFGASEPIASMFFSPASLGYREDLNKAYAFNLDTAAKLLEKAGVKNLTLNTYVTPRWPVMKLFCLIWQADLAKIGVKLNVTEVEQAKFMEAGGAKDFTGLDMIPWVVGRATRDPAIFFGTQVTHRGGKTAKYGWLNDELEKLIEEGAKELDVEKRRKIYQRCNEIIVEEVPMIHVANDPRMWAWSTKVKGVTTDLVGDITLTDARVEG